MRTCVDCGKADLAHRNVSHMRCVACYVNKLHGMVAAGKPYFQEALEALPPLRRELAAKLRAEIRAMKSQLREAERAAEKANAKELESQEKYGASVEFVAQHKKWIRMFTHQKCSAATRGVEFLLSFKDWIGVWKESGKMDSRGRGKDLYCMARHGDVGPYAIGNVSIKTCSENIKEYQARKQAGKSKGKPASAPTAAVER